MLEKRGHRFVRYADDITIYVRSKRAAERVMASLKLRVNQDQDRPEGAQARQGSPARDHLAPLGRLHETAHP